MLKKVNFSCRLKEFIIFHPFLNSFSLMKYILLLISLIIFPNLWSQLNVQGKILDSSAVKPVPGAIVIASRVKDSLIVQFTRSNRNGEFMLKNLPVDTFKITIGHSKFEDQQLFVFGNKDEKNIQLPNIKLDHVAKELKEIIIYANKSPIYYKGDTLVFVADSFKVRENAVAEDLLRKLPGVSVDARGKVTFQGRDIDQIYVDGDEFFGNDPTVATKNLGAKAIQNVQIYEMKNNTENGEESKQIMNLTLKDDAKKGYFGKASIAIDGHKFYEGEILFNRYQNKKNYSFYLLKNNTPRLGFNWQDQNKYGLNTEMNNTSNGFPDNFTTGARFKNNYGKNNKHFFEINYQYRDLKSTNISTNNTQFLVGDTSYYNNSEQNNNTRQQNHTLTIENKWKLDSLTTLELTPELKYSLQNSNKKSNSSFLNNNRDPFRSSTNNVSDSIVDITFSNNLKLEKKYMNPKRESTITSNFTYSDNQNNGSVDFTNQTSNLLKQTNQINDISQKSLNQTLNLFHTEPITKKINLNLEYLNNTSSDKQNRTISDIQNQQLVYDSLFSSDYTKTSTVHRGKVSFTRKSGAHTVIVGSALRNLALTNTNNITQSVLNLNDNQYLPYASYTFNQKNAIRISAGYNTSSPIPSINQLQPVLNNTNLNYQTIGNPDLKPSYKQSANLSLFRFDNLNSRYFYIRTNADFIDNDFANALTFDNSGRTIAQTVNVNGNQNYSVNGFFSQGFPKKYLTLSGRFDLSHSLGKTIINATQYNTYQTSVTPSINVSYATDTLTISLDGSMSYNKPSGSSLGTTQNPYYSYNNTLDISWTIPKINVLFTTSLNQQITTGRTNGFNLNRTIWNATISKYVLKNQKLNIGIEAYDILNQNLQIQRTITSNQISDIRNTIITQYFLVRLSYRFDPPNTEKESKMSKTHPFGPGMKRTPRNEKY
jgi:hypothetical protein